MNPPAVRLEDVVLEHGRARALSGVTLDVPTGSLTGVLGPDGVGKSSLLSLVAGARAVQSGTVSVLGGSMRDREHRAAVCPRIAYMPQGLGKNLYATLSVWENVRFFARLFGQPRAEREHRIRLLLDATGLAPFRDRPAGKLSGGMKQKLGLCCALVHDPDLLVLDEPTTGVDPLSRRQFWKLIDALRRDRPEMTVIVATAYMQEALAFDLLVAMDAGRVLATGSASDLLARTGAADLDAAFVALLPESRRGDHGALRLGPPPEASADVLIEADHLSMRFGEFTAVDDVSFRIRRGEIFGFLGSNGCGKTTTMKMLTGLLAPTGGSARLFGRAVTSGDAEARRHVGYMSQSFSLYGELTVEQNLRLHGRLFGLRADHLDARVDELARRFELTDRMTELPADLPLGVRQRLSLAVALVHSPDVLILDEPTSGVDPIARDRFWEILGKLSRTDGVTIFVSTHFMNEAAMCDRVSLMHAGRVLACDTPAALAAASGGSTLEDAFIELLDSGSPAAPVLGSALPAASRSPRRAFDMGRLLAYVEREALEVRRDPIRATLAFAGSLLLMLVMAYGINMDVEHLSFAVLDRDGTATSREYAAELAASPYFDEQAPLSDHAELDRRMRSGSLGLALEIPPGFERAVLRGVPTEVGAWVDGAMPARAETLQGYAAGMHAYWLAERQRTSALGAGAPAHHLAVRYRYNPNVESLPSMVPGVIPLLLMMIPAMLAALSVVREKELGSVVNLYVTPVSRLEFLLGKQLPYVALAFCNAALLAAFAVFVFGVPITGSVAAIAMGALLYVTCATGLGMLISSFMRSQMAAIFGTALATMLPAVQFSGMINPVSSLGGLAAVIGRVYPTRHFLDISRGVFSKSLTTADVLPSLLALLITVPVITMLATLRLKKQEA